MSDTKKSGKKFHRGDCPPGCDWCKSNRTHKNDKRVEAAKQDEKEVRDA